MKNNASGWLRWAAGQPGTGNPPGLAAQVILAHVLGRPRAWVLAHPEAALRDDQVERLDGLLARLAQGTPLPYLTGEQEFYGLAFTVTPAVLIPRPETELLVEEALAWLRANPSRRSVADVGAGSGCIAVTLAKHIPDLRVTALDRSETALEVARANAARHGVLEQISFQPGDLLDGIPPGLDLICANLPYIPTGVLAGLDVAKYEPSLALDGGPDGLELIRALVGQAGRVLAPGGLLLLEIQYDQGPAVCPVVAAALPGARARVLQDLAGLDRLVRIENGGEVSK